LPSKSSRLLLLSFPGEPYVYTCGALLHNGELIIPYGLADHATGFATVPLAEVLAAMN
jgi:predicted GH43/DUF377 family glycosyl hydrolase